MSFFIIATLSLLLPLVFSQSCTETTGVEFTFYGFYDGNDDVTSLGCSNGVASNQGGIAGGSGTYSDPETFATDMSSTTFKPCEIVYLPYLRKYFQYMDHCSGCNDMHIDLWIGPDSNGGQAQLTCELDFGSVSDQTVIQSPPSNLPVQSGALWDGTTCYNNPSQGRVFPNPSTSGLCSGGSTSPGGGSTPSAGSSAPVSTPSTASVVVPPTQPAPTSQPTPPSSTLFSSSVINTPPSNTPIEPPAPTTLATVTSAVSNTIIPDTSSTSSLAPSGSSGSCAWAGHCIGAPCQSYDDCSGDWICIAGKCHSNLDD